MLRLGFAIGRARHASAGIGGASSSSWAGEPATGFMSVLSLPILGDTFTIGARTYRWQATLSQAYDVLIADTIAHCARNAEAAINAEGTGYSVTGTSGTTCFGTGTLANDVAFVADPTPRTDGLSVLIALYTGTAGNSIVPTFSAPSRMTMQNGFGAGGGTVTGTATSVIYQNWKTQMQAGAGFGALHAVFICLGTNDAIRTGLRGRSFQTERGRSFQTEIARLIAQIRADFGAQVKIILWKPWTAGSTLANAALTSVIHAAVDALVATDNGNTSFVDGYALQQATVTDTATDTQIVDNFGVHGTHYAYESMLPQQVARAVAAALGLAA